MGKDRGQEPRGKVVPPKVAMSVCGSRKGQAGNIRCQLGVLHDGPHEATDEKGRLYSWATTKPVRLGSHREHE